jgi:hypothetical protein
MSRINNFEVLTPAKAKKISEAIAEAVLQVHHDGQVYWEKQMKLVINEKPRLMPVWLWGLALALVVRQTIRDGDVPRPVHVVTEVRDR